MGPHPGVIWHLFGSDSKDTLEAGGVLAMEKKISSHTRAGILEKVANMYNYFLAREADVIIRVSRTGTGKKFTPIAFLRAAEESFCSNCLLL
jgi:hypothetical protein